jgi:hypothetical protein
MGRTTLQDPENNKPVKKDESNKLFLYDVISSVKFRIAKHREFIKRDYETIQNNIGCSDIINDALIRIKSREDKIDELNEFVEHCL